MMTNYSTTNIVTECAFIMWTHLFQYVYIYYTPEYSISFRNPSTFFTCTISPIETLLCAPQLNCHVTIVTLNMWKIYITTVTPILLWQNMDLIIRSNKYSPYQKSPHMVQAIPNTTWSYRSVYYRHCRIPTMNYYYWTMTKYRWAVVSVILVSPTTW